MNNILIIGGCGYIGSRLFDYLSSKNLYSIDTVDLEWYGNNVNPKNIIVNFKDLTKEYLSKYDGVVLLAAHSSVSLGENQKLETFQNNVANFVYLLSKLNKSQKFIYASSSSVYGNSPKDVCGEGDSIEDGFVNFYDLSKRQRDQYAELSGLNYYGLRFGTVNGFSKNFRSDLIINAMYRNALIGKEISCINGSTKRAILDITDLCMAIERILVCKKDSPGIYNLASFNSTVKEIAERVSKSMDSRIVYSEKGSSRYSFFTDCSKFKENFDFEFAGSIDGIVQDLKNNYNEIFVSKVRA